MNRQVRWNKIIKVTTDSFEKSIIDDSSISDEEKSEIFLVTTFAYMNSELISENSIELAEIPTPNGRISGFFGSLIRIIATIITWVASGIIVGGILGGEAGGMVGGVIGLVVAVVKVIINDCICYDCINDPVTGDLQCSVSSCHCY